MSAHKTRRRARGDRPGRRHARHPRRRDRRHPGLPRRWFRTPGRPPRPRRTRTATGGLLWARTRHATSRAGDPNPHDHVLVANVVEMLDARGGWKGLDTAALRDIVHAATMVGRLAVGRQGRRARATRSRPDAGPSGRLDHWQIAGIPDAGARGVLEAVRRDRRRRRGRAASTRRGPGASPPATTRERRRRETPDSLIGAVAGRARRRSAGRRGGSSGASTTSPAPTTARCAPLDDVERDAGRRTRPARTGRLAAGEGVHPQPTSSAAVAPRLYGYRPGRTRRTSSTPCSATPRRSRSSASPAPAAGPGSPPPSSPPKQAIADVADRLATDRPARRRQR